jgi:hypothetical protein
MELNGWQLRGNLLEGMQGDIKALVPLQPTRIQNNPAPVLPGSWNAPEKLLINMVNKNRAPAVQSRSSSIFVQPEVVSDDDPVCERG